VDNFTPIPNDYIDQLADGRLTPAMFTILCYLRRTCTWSKGAWRGTAERVHHGLNQDLSVRQVQRYLKRLHDCLYIASHHIPGRRQGYKIDICNYVAVDDDGEKLLRPTITKDWQELELQGDAEDDAGMTASCRGNVANVDAETTTIPDVPDIYPDIPNVPHVPDNPQVRKEGRQGEPRRSDQGKEFNPESEPRNYSERLGRSLDSEEWHVAQRTYMEVLDVHPRDMSNGTHTHEDIVAFAEVCVDLQERLNWEASWDNDHPIRDFVHWNKTHKKGGMIFANGRGIARAHWSDSPRSALRQWEQHNSAECPKCKREIEVAQ
jgi:hypothetical protein